VVGQDGISYAPVRKTEEMRAIRDQITAWNGNPSDEECAGHLKGIGMFEWATIREYLDCLERNRTATNVAVLVPQVSSLWIVRNCRIEEPTGEPEIAHLRAIERCGDEGTY
jgi:N-acyl-D-aspartate/D-glutamate deacylase